MTHIHTDRTVELAAQEARVEDREALLAGQESAS